jgi:ribA/ribD-fused uncharacterized protein
MHNSKDILRDYSGDEGEFADQYGERKKRAAKRERCKVTDRVIQFYRESDSYGCFSNFSKHSIVMNGVRWPTVEHYFQGQKFAGLPMEQKIRNAEGPGAAKKLGQTRKVRLRGDWEQVKNQIMYDAVLAKFSQHDNIRTTLLKTDDAILVEHTSNDSYWGDGGDGRGKNMLGKTLMLVREELRNRQEQQQCHDVANINQEQKTPDDNDNVHENDEVHEKGKRNNNHNNNTDRVGDETDKEEKEEKEEEEGQRKNMRLTLQKKGVKKVVILNADRKLEDLQKVIQQKFKAKAKKISTYPDGQEVDQTLLSGLEQDAVLIIA